MLPGSEMDTDAYRETHGLKTKYRFYEGCAGFYRGEMVYELEEVIDFYNEGGGEDPHKSPLLEPLQLTSPEKKDLLAFLKSLSGDQIRMMPPELPEYVSVVDSEEGVSHD